MRVKVPTIHHHHREVPLKSAKDRTDIIAAYQELGSYRAAADVCSTTHKTVKRVMDKFAAEQAGEAPAVRASGTTTTTRWPIWSPSGSPSRRAGCRPNGCCRSPAPRDTPARTATSVAWSPRRKRCGAGNITAAAVRRCGHRGSIWSSTGPKPHRDCSCFARCWHSPAGGSWRSPLISGHPPHWR